MEGHYGSKQIIIKHGGEVITDRFGMTTGSITFQVPAGRWDLLPSIGSSHPYASFIHMERRRIKTAPGIWTIVGDYAGAYNKSEPIYELTRSVAREPIETHNKFVSHIGGKPSAPKNGAIFVDGSGNLTQDNTVGVFERFSLAAPDGSLNDFAGVDGYYAPTNTVWTKSWSDKNRPTDDDKVGFVDSPEGSPPSYGNGFNWLYMGLSYVERGKSFSLKKQWRLSGRRGWNGIIYSP